MSLTLTLLNIVVVAGHSLMKRIAVALSSSSPGDLDRDEVVVRN